MKIIMALAAKNDFLNTIEYYNNKREKLGFEFASEVKDSILLISMFPASWPKFTDRLRRCHLKRFPYAILYRFENNQITIAAIMHLSRDPKRWQDRK